jgi:predicted O-methyltransferase YrrM
MDDALHSILRELERFGAENDARVRQRQEKMLNITRDTGELLSILIGGSKAKRVLEVGTSNGYSTLWLADAVKAISGNVVTLEMSEAKAAMARHNFERSELSPWIRLHVTEAGQFLREQPFSHFDLIFLDSDRDQYVTWWPWIQNVLAPGGLLVVDNAVSHAAEMKDFIAEVSATPGWRSVVVPIGNGEFVALRS